MKSKELTLFKNAHRYIFRYKEGDEAVLINTLIDKFQDSSCALDWFDVVFLSHHIGEKFAEDMKKILKEKLGVNKC